ncbi:hypothetical protein [Acidisphaera sp. L21]|jgi:hypothetical protein|nr:hypothetical protein [Acidisphaera sp. L21]
MYFGDALPEVSAEQKQDFAKAERRLLRRLAILGCLGVVVMIVTLV